jgi:hypothetical protein
MSDFAIYQSRCDAVLNAKTGDELERARTQLLALGEKGADALRSFEKFEMLPKVGPASARPMVSPTSATFSVFSGVRTQ